MKSTVGSGTLTTEEMIGNVNRNISKALEITNEYNVGNINLNYVETKKGWSQIGEVFSTDAAIIGALGDDLFNNGEKNMKKYFEKLFIRNSEK